MRKRERDVYTVRGLIFISISLFLAHNIGVTVDAASSFRRTKNALCWLVDSKEWLVCTETSDTFTNDRTDWPIDRPNERSIDRSIGRSIDPNLESRCFECLPQVPIRLYFTFFLSFFLPSFLAWSRSTIPSVSTRRREKRIESNGQDNYLAPIKMEVDARSSSLKCSTWLSFPRNRCPITSPETKKKEDVLR